MLSKLAYIIGHCGSRHQLYALSILQRVEKVRDSKRSGASADYVYEPLLWYFNELLFLVDQDSPDESRSTLHEEN
jgi:hypothetical protein